jgi:hypothetical protein
MIKLGVWICLESFGILYNLLNSVVWSVSCGVIYIDGLEFEIERAFVNRINPYNIFSDSL